MSAIEMLIEGKLKEQEQHRLAQLEKDREEKEQIRRSHQERLDYLHSELGDAWYELMQFSDVEEYDQFTSILKVEAADLELRPFFVKITSRVQRGHKGKLQISFYINDENWPHYDLGQFLADMRSDFPAWKEEQSLNAHLAEIEQEYCLDYVDWLVECKTIDQANQKLLEAKQQELDNCQFTLCRFYFDEENPEENSFYPEFVLNDMPNEKGYWNFWTRSGEKYARIFKPFALEYLGMFNPSNSPSQTKCKFLNGYELYYGPNTNSEELRAWTVENLTDLPDEPERPGELSWRRIEWIQDDVREQIANSEV